jgi:Carboxypeptidase regulatory-like domain
MATFTVAIAVSDARAQDPGRLPRVTISAEPGPGVMTGVVRDTLGLTLEDVEVTIPKLQRRTTSRADGTFRFDDLRNGTYIVRARRLGYAAQTREIKVGSLGGSGDFGLWPIPHALPALVSSAARGGLSGVVDDATNQGVAGATVRVLGEGLAAPTDSAGEFFLPVRRGKYMIAITKPGFTDKVVAVTIPADSGRRIAAFLQLSSGETPLRERWNIPDLRSRMAWRDKSRTGFYTHEDMERLGIKWIFDAVRMGTNLMGWTTAPDDDCAVIVDGGPRTALLSLLTIDEVESVEVYKTVPPLSAKLDEDPTKIEPAHINNANEAAVKNQGKRCPTVFVWMR